MRCTGCDSFDDFELMILAHEAYFDQKLKRVTTSVKITAGSHRFQTERSSQSVFQQPLAVWVEQGTKNIVVDLLDHRDRVVATLKLDPQKDCLAIHQKGQDDKLVEKTYIMKVKDKCISNPKIKLTIVFDGGTEVETGLIAGLNLSSSTEWQVRQQLKKSGGVKTGHNEAQMVAQACAGGLDMFRGMGNADSVHVAVVGPPLQKKYTFCVWESLSHFEKQQKAQEEVDLLRIRSVQADPGRSNVFHINYVDSNRITRQLSFRRIDRSREVWIELLQLLIKQVHTASKEKKDKKAAN